MIHAPQAGYGDIAATGHVATQRFTSGSGGGEGRMWQFFNWLWTEESGADQGEYALLLIFIVLAGIAVVHVLGIRLGDVFGDVGAKLQHLESRYRRHQW
jgi:Flp pilus assembly pilin Flp